MLAVLAGGCRGTPAGAPADFSQAQGHLEALDGAPLVSASWEGRYRPYLLRDGRWTPLVPRSVAPGWDLYTPLAAPGRAVLLAGSERGRPAHDLFLWDGDGLRNLTASPDVDDGEACVEAALVAWRAGGRERVARLVDGALVALRDAGLPPFRHCLFADALWGVERRGDRMTLHRCVVEGERVACAARAALADADDVARLVRLPDGVGVIARRRGATFRRAWRLEGDGERLAAIDTPPAGFADVLDHDGRVTRYGFHGRYWTTIEPGFDGVVYVTRRIGDADWAIVAGPTEPRTPARAENGRWVPVRFAAPRAVASRPREIWIRSPAGALYQIWYVGPDAPRDVVVWWHGGPRESVSPRFHPYWARLEALGWGVVAVNYPGSTGRGASWEARFEADALAECVAAVLAWLREEGVRRVVSWSVSTGIQLQGVLLAHGMPVSTIIDQAGFGSLDLREPAAARGIRFFAIRGRQDTWGRIARVDHWYDGGHDLTAADQFEALFAAVAPVLRDAPAVEWPTAPAGGGVVVVPEGARGEAAALSFELAGHVADTCGPDVQLARSGSETLRRAVEVEAGVRRRLADDADVPVVALEVSGGGDTEVACSPDAAPRLRTHGIDAARELTAPVLGVPRRGPVVRVRAGRPGGDVELRADGAIVRTRLREVARAVCPVVEALRGGGDS